MLLFIWVLNLTTHDRTSHPEIAFLVSTPAALSAQPSPGPCALAISSPAPGQCALEIQVPVHTSRRTPNPVKVPRLLSASSPVDSLEGN